MNQKQGFYFLQQQKKQCFYKTTSKLVFTKKKLQNSFGNHDCNHKKNVTKKNRKITYRDNMLIIKRLKNILCC